MTYKSTRRQWVKLWVNEWLDGTTRFELTAQQRLLWIDLLALAGRSRFPGLIYAGEGENGKRVGYPLAYLAGVLQMDEVTLNNALKLLETHQHITLEEISPDKFVIGIMNWEKYQSEYLRQRTYRKVTTKTTKRLPVEGEEEVEVEGEVEAAEERTAFAAINCEPFGSKAFRSIWVDEYQNKPNNLGWADSMERVVQCCKSQGIKVPGRFFAHKREIEKIEAELAYKKTPL